MQASWNLVLTGTPLQNALKELFVLLAFLENTTPADVEARIRELPDPSPPEHPLAHPEGDAPAGPFVPFPDLMSMQKRPQPL